MRRFFYPIITFIGIVILSELVLSFLNNETKKKEAIALSNTSFSIIQNIQQQVTMGITSTTTLELMLKINDYNVKNFEQWAKEILKNAQSIDNLQLAPNGVVSYIYPIKDHKKAIGHDLLSDPDRRKGALKALEANETIFIGPLKLIQNNKLAIIARKPISKIENEKEEFWGFSTAILYIDEIVDNTFKGLDKSSFSYKLFGSNPDFPDSLVISQSDKPLTSDAKTFPIKVPNGEWYLTINYISNSGVFSKYIIHLLVFILSLVASILIYNFEKRSYIQRKRLEKLNLRLQKMANTDMLTQLSNRRSAFNFMQKQLALCIREKKDFSLCFLDLDYFKKINDKYGHKKGDLALKHLAELFGKNIRESDMFARWGGEEFVLALPMTDKEKAFKICESLRKLLSQNPLLVDGENINMSISIGISNLTEKDKDLDTLINYADDALYQSKLNGRNQTSIHK